jgi:hypothetical protein
MALEPAWDRQLSSEADGPDQFVICLFKRNEKDHQEYQNSQRFINSVEASIRSSGGKIQIRTERLKDWDIFDGKDNITEPNHLNPAIFDFGVLLVGAFSNSHDVYSWWNSDPVFEILKYRTPIEKMGVYVIEGMQQAYDVSDRNHTKVAFGERLVLIEFINMQSFKPVQQYVDNYRIYAEHSLNDIGIDINMLFAEGVSGVLMNEFPLDAAIASLWRMKSDALLFYDSDAYQRDFMKARKDYSRSLAMLIPIFDERLMEGRELVEKKQKQQLVARRR